MSQREDLEIKLGSTWVREIPFTDDAGNPVDLTGYDFAMQARDPYNAASALVDLSVANGKITVSAALGIITLRLAPADTQAITNRRADYDLRSVDPSGDVDFPKYGVIRFVPTVTHVTP